MTPSFPLLSRRELLDSFAKISPEKYAKTRNFLTGAVTRLSPYITHGVIRTPELVESVLSRSSPFQADQLLKELIWKEYFTQVLAHRKDEVLRDIEPDKSGISKVSFLPLSVIQGTTGRDWLDRIIWELKETWYLHNHARMWLASYLSHFGRLHWKLLADWTHYHFLDGDIASNHLSWQWVASTFSSKPYFFTSENTERYGNFSVKELTGSYDEVWENISDIHRVGPFEECTDGAGILQTDLSRFPVMTSLPSDHILLLTPWSLSETLVQAYPEHTPVLIFDTNFFERYPMSPKRIDFISEYAEKLWATQMRWDLSHLIQTYTGPAIVGEMTYQPIYRDILETASDTKNCTILPYPSVHPRFGKTYFNRFFGYFQAIDWKKVEFKSLQ